MVDNSLENRNYTDLPKKIVNKGNKKGYRKTIFLLITIAFLFTGVVITSLIVLKLKEKAPVKPPKPKAVCPWYAPKCDPSKGRTGGCCPDSWYWNSSDCVGEPNPADPGAQNCCCTESRPQPTALPNQCRIIYDDNKCFTVSGQMCVGKPLSSFRKPYSGTTQTNDRSICSTTSNHKSEGTVPDAGPHTYCADAQPGECVQFDHDFEGIGPNDEIVNQGGVCECEPPVSSPTPTHTPTATPTATATPTSTPTATPTGTPTATPTGTPPPSSTPTATNTPPPAASNTPTPTEIVLAQASATVEPTIPSAGKTAPWIIAALPIMIVILGLLL